MLLNRSNYQSGTGLLKYHKGNYIQSGGGFGSLLGRLFSKLLPVAKSAAKTALSTAKKAANSELGQTLQNTAISTLANSTADLITGEKEPKQTLQEGVEQAKQQIATALRTKASGKRSSSILENPKDKKSKRKKKKNYNLLEETL